MSYRQQTFNGRPVPFIRVNSIPTIPLLPGVAAFDAESIPSRSSSTSSHATRSSVASAFNPLPINPPRLPAFEPMEPLSEDMFGEEMLAEHAQDSAEDVALPDDHSRRSSSDSQKTLIGDMLLDVIDEEEPAEDHHQRYEHNDPFSDSTQPHHSPPRPRSYGNPSPSHPLRVTNPDTIPPTPPSRASSVDSTAESTHSAFSFAPSVQEGDDAWETRLKRAIEAGTYIERRDFRIRQIQMDARGTARMPVRRNGYGSGNTSRSLGLLEGEK